MSQFMIVSATQAQNATQGVIQALVSEFNEAARKDLLGGRVRVKRISTAEFGVEVDLKRAPTVEEKARLPQDHNGVRIIYQQLKI